jgi:hypothetical protein
VRASVKGVVPRYALSKRLFVLRTKSLLGSQTRSLARPSGSGLALLGDFRVGEKGCPDSSTNFRTSMFNPDIYFQDLISRKWNMSSYC